VLVCFRACIKQRTPFDLSKRTSQEDTDTMATVAFETRTTSRKKRDVENCLEFARFPRVLPRCMQLRRKYCLADSCLFNPDVDPCVMLCGLWRRRKERRGQTPAPVEVESRLGSRECAGNP
jgi:hypothetical protein